MGVSGYDNIQVLLVYIKIPQSSLYEAQTPKFVEASDAGRVKFCRLNVLGFCRLAL